jgi:hypothetical protein
MPTSPPPPPAVTREPLHLRRIEMRGFRRSDGLFELEATLVDTKPRDFTPPVVGRLVPAGEALHQFAVRLVFDAGLTVLDVHAATEAAPYAECPGAAAALQTLKGLSMTSGWNKAVRERLAGAASCTHLMELLTPMATAAFQSLAGLFPERSERVDADGRPLKIDSCYGYRAQGEVVLKRWPAFHRAE